MSSLNNNTSGGNRAWRAFLPALAVALATLASTPASADTCAADRDKQSLNCTANDVEIASISVVGGTPASCRAGDMVDLDLIVNLHVNANNSHDVGVFLALDGKSPMIQSSLGGSANCSVHGIPFSPLPFANLDGNGCGDFDRSGIPQGTVVSAQLDTGHISVLCTPDANGQLVLANLVSWDPNPPAVCTPPGDLKPGSPSKCEAGSLTPINVTVQGKISITKQTSPPGASGTFSYTATGSGVAPTTFSLQGGQTQVLTTGNLTSSAQTYTVTEAQLGGFNPTAQISCVDQNGAAQPTFVTTDTSNRSLSVQMSASPAAGLTQVFCTYTNAAGSSITINKLTSGGNGTFGFTGPNGPFSITTSNGAGQVVIGGLNAGTYTVTEAVPAGWNLEGLTCSDPTGDTTTSGATATIALASTENVSCTFSDLKLASLTIFKQTEPHSTQVFSFTTSGLTPGTFTLFDNGSPATYTQVFPGLLPGGAYSVAEAVPAGFKLTGLSCSDANDPNAANRSTVNLATGTLTASIQAGEDLQCTFTNTAIVPASITVTKVAFGADGTFPFSNSGGGALPANPASFSITTSGTDHVGVQQLTGLAAGTYVITETVPNGWLLGTPISCTVVNGSNTTITQVSNGVSIVLGTTGLSVDSVACVFSDTRETLGVTDVPTLSEWAMAILSLALLGAGYLGLRRRRVR